MSISTYPTLSPAFDIPAGIAIYARTTGGAWAPCHVRGVVLAWDYGAVVPKRADVRVLCERDDASQMEAVTIAVKLRRMGWANTSAEARDEA